MLITFTGRTVIVGIARLGGSPIGIISNNCEVQAGALDAQGSQKLMRHLKFLDIFNIPLVQFVDVPGYAIGLAAERAATIRWGVELAKVGDSFARCFRHVCLHFGLGL